MSKARERLDPGPRERGVDAEEVLLHNEYM